MADDIAGAEAPEQSEVGLGETAAPQTSPPEQSAPAVPEMFTIKVGGEEQQVTLEEALNGYQRQQDYTRKTQELAEQREQLGDADRLWRQLEADPERVVRALAEAYELDFGMQKPAAGSDNDLGDEDLEPSDPRWSKVEQFMEQAQMAQLQAQIDRQLVDLHSTYGKFDDNDLMQFAVDNQISNLEVAFQAFAFDRMSRVAGDRQVQQRKQELPPVAGGHGVAEGAVAPGVVTSKMSMREAYEAAEKQLGLG